MKKVVTTILDRVAKVHSDPVCHINEPSAIRDFEHALKQQKFFAGPPDDYELWLVGEWNTEEGYMTQLDCKLIAKGGDDGSS